MEFIGFSNPWQIFTRCLHRSIGFVGDNSSNLDTLLHNCIYNCYSFCSVWPKIIYADIFWSPVGLKLACISLSSPGLEINTLKSQLPWPLPFQKQQLWTLQIFAVMHLPMLGSLPTVACINYCPLDSEKFKMKIIIINISLLLIKKSTSFFTLFCCKWSNGTQYSPERDWMKLRSQPWVWLHYCSSLQTRNYELAHCL